MDDHPTPPIVIQPPPELLAAIREIEETPRAVQPVRPRVVLWRATSRGTLAALAWACLSGFAQVRLGWVSAVIGWAVGTGAVRGGRGRRVQATALVVTLTCYLVGLLGMAAIWSVSPGDLSWGELTLMYFVALIQQTLTSIHMLDLAISGWLAWSITAER